jgi:hypothetical protein
MHEDYDRMFADIREKMGIKAGEPIKPEHLT